MSGGALTVAERHLMQERDLAITERDRYRATLALIVAHQCCAPLDAREMQTLARDALAAEAVT